MSSLIDELARKQILTAQAVADIRKYIAAKFPSISAMEKARVFADAVNRVVDRNIPELPEEQKQTLKHRLFRQASGKPAFSLDRAEVFIAAVEVKEEGRGYFKSMTSWLGDSLGHTLDEESVASLILRVRRLMDEVPGYSIAEAMSAVEAGLAETWQEELARGNTDIPAEPEQPVPVVEAAAPGEVESVLQIYREEDGQESAGEVKEAGSTGEDREARKAGEAGKREWKVRLGRALLAAGLVGLALFSLLSFDPFIDTGTAKAAPIPTYIMPEQVAGTAGETELHGTHPDNERLVSRNGDADSQTKWRGKRIFEATAYDLSIESCGKSPGDPAYGITASGVKALAGRTIAVDPEQIPLGTRVYITFPAEYAGMNGTYVAEDTVSLIKGRHIDIFFGEDKTGKRSIYQQALNFGVRSVEVEIID